MVVAEPLGTGAAAGTGTTGTGTTGTGTGTDAALLAQLEEMLDASRVQQRHLRTSILRVLEYLEHPSTR